MPPARTSRRARTALGLGPPGTPAPASPFDGGAGCAGDTQVAQRLIGVVDPFLCVRSLGRLTEKRTQMLHGAVGVAALHEQEAQAVVRAGEPAIQFEGAAVMTYGFVDALCL